MRFFWWIQKILYVWVRSKNLPEKPKDFLKLDPNKPVCYILGKKTYSDLFVLDHHCKVNGLPRPIYRPETIMNNKNASFIYLKKLGLVLSRGNKKRPPSALLKIVEQVENGDEDLQIVPVSVYWGRNPGKQESSWFKLLFADNENTGLIQKFFTIIAHGRGVFCNFGKPISVKNLLSEGLGVEQSTKKLVRVLRVHYRRHRIKTLGPEIYLRSQVINTVVSAKPVQQASEDEAHKKNVSLEKVTLKAHRYADEIAADLTTTALRFFDILLSWMWRKVYKGIESSHFERLNEITESKEIIYVPCHRSHIDYLLINYLVYHHGLMAPHTAAGINLDFWPVGGLLRRGGAFYIRRTFRGNRLYSMIFKEYVHYLLRKGHPLQFFPEGGRSRTGMLLQPKTGMLAMVIESYLRDDNKPIVFVPVYAAYDKVMEAASYMKELGGKKKKSESIGQLIKAGSLLFSNFGKAYVGFGKPIDVEEFFGSEIDQWKKDYHHTGWSKDYNPKVLDLAKEIMTRINRVAVVSPTSLVSLALLANPKKAMTEEDLIGVISALLKVQKAMPYDQDIKLPNDQPKDMVKYVEKTLGLQRFRHPDGDVIHVNEYQAILLTYYRNNNIHLFSIPSMIAGCFQHNDELSSEDVKQLCLKFYPFFKDEFFLKWKEEEISDVVTNYIEQFIKIGLLQKEDKKDMLCRPDVDTQEFTFLNTIARIMSNITERYAVASALLYSAGKEDGVDREEFESKWQDMSRRLSLLGGTSEYTTLKKSQLGGYLNLLKAKGYIYINGTGKLKIEPPMEKLFSCSLNVLSLDIRKSIGRLSRLNT